MALKILFLLYFYFPFVVTLVHEKRVAEKVWSERCNRNSIALNDCNWCHCDIQNQYKCKARACNEVDMFGHFNDAIQEMDVGMEGHGVWRSEATPCESGVHYRKDELLCVCTEDGTWPNPVCRDTFRLLHAVESTNFQKPENNQTCSYSKLYLYGCNVCFCPSTEKIDPKLCTQRKCDGENQDDAARTSTSTTKEFKAEEVYASCTPSKRYRLGCQSCVCLRNNRLLCDNCTSNADESNVQVDVASSQNSLCHNKKPKVLFEKDCNICHCDKKDTIYCSVKKCLSEATNVSLPKLNFDTVDQTPDDYNCIPGSKFEKDCNTCHCFMLDGVKYFGCTVKSCKKDQQPERDCVGGTSYKMNCLICHCVVENNTKREFCTIDDSCKLEENWLNKAAALSHGYCEPMHFYQVDCNKCRCLADGKMIACTSKICSKMPKLVEQPIGSKNSKLSLKSRMDITTDNSLIMEFIPFIQKDNYCPKGHSYMIDCNICYCMENGNAICSTKQC